MNIYEMESTRFGVSFEKVGGCWVSRLVKLDIFWCIYCDGRRDEEMIRYLQELYGYFFYSK